jgi:hypothetical protein
MIDKRSLPVQLHVLNLLSRIIGINKESQEAINKGIAKQWIRSIGVYGLDDKNHCHVGLILILNWTVYTIRVWVVEDREAIDETVSTEDDVSPAVANAVIVNATQVFNQAVDAGHLRIEWYCRYEQGLDPLAIDKELGLNFVLPQVSELPEVKVSLRDFSPASIPSEHLQATLQHLYALDIHTQSSQRPAKIQPITIPVPPESAKHVQHREIIDIHHISDMVSQASLGGEPTQQDEQAKAIRQHVEQLREETKIPQGIIYEGRPLPPNTERQVKPLIEALQNENHVFRQFAEETVRKFADTVEKSKLSNVTSLSQASRDYHIPLSILSEWVAKELIPVQYRDRKTIYVARETLEKVAQAHQEAKEQGMQTARLLRAMRGKLGFSRSYSSSKPEG